MSISKQFIRLINTVLPQDCFLCGKLAGRDLLCQACVNDLLGLPPAVCPVCAIPTPDAAICGNCLKRPPHFDTTCASLRYAFPLDRLVHALKYQHRLAVSGLFSSLLLKKTPHELAQADLLMALPLSAHRLRERGFNQSLEIARPLGQQFGLPLAINGYARILDTAPQASLPWKERKKNIQGAFECTQDLGGKRIVVIDDVMTTGATLNEFARTLKKHGAATVTNWVVARALRD